MVASIDTILYQLEAIGVFNYLLPVLLVFALTYGILSTTKIAGTQRGIHTVIAFVIGLMAIRLGFTQDFFSQIFPRLGIGLAVLLSILILVGLFVPKQEFRYWGWGLGAIGVTIAIIIITQSFDALGWIGYSLWSDYVGYIIGGVLLIGLIIAIAAGGGKDEEHRGEPVQVTYGPWRKNE